MSRIREGIYQTLGSKDEYTWNYTECTIDGINAVTKFMNDQKTLEWVYDEIQHPDCEGFTTAYSWIENDEPQLLMLSCRTKAGMM